MGMTYNRSQSPSREQCIRLLHEAVERGVTLLIRPSSTAPSSNELLAGKLFPLQGKISVTTKFGHEVINGKGRAARTAARKPSGATATSRCAV